MPPDAKLSFRRLTQLGLLRLLTTRALMGEGVLTLAEAWTAYEGLYRSGRVLFVDEPDGLDKLFRLRTDRDESSPKLWADAYLAAFATAAELTLATLDRALAGSVAEAILNG